MAFTTIDTEQFNWKTGLKAAHAAIDANFTLLASGGAPSLALAPAATAAITVTGTPTKILSAGSYASPLTQSTTEMSTIATTKASGFSIGYGAYLEVTGEDCKPFGFASLVESVNTTGTPTLQGAQFMAFLGKPGGVQAAHLKTRGGDATAGMYGAWLKIGANSNCVCDSGSRAAALWVDNQLSGTVSGEEYGIFASTGASRPTSFLGFETTSSGYSQLLYFDETFNSGAGTCITTETVPSNAQDAMIKVYYNGTQYYIPLWR